MNILEYHIGQSATLNVCEFHAFRLPFLNTQKKNQMGMYALWALADELSCIYFKVLSAWGGSSLEPHPQQLSSQAMLDLVLVQIFWYTSHNRLVALVVPDCVMPFLFAGRTYQVVCRVCVLLWSLYREEEEVWTYSGDIETLDSGIMLGVWWMENWMPCYSDLLEKQLFGGTYLDQVVGAVTQW